MALPQSLCVFGYTGIYESGQGANTVTLPIDELAGGLPTRSISVHHGSQALRFPEYVGGTGQNNYQMSVIDKEWQAFSHPGDSGERRSIKVDITDIPEEYTDPNGSAPHKTLVLKDIYYDTYSDSDSSIEMYRGIGYVTGVQPVSMNSTNFESNFSVLDRNDPYIDYGQTNNCADIVPIYDKYNTRKVQVNQLRTDTGPDISELSDYVRLSIVLNSQVDPHSGTRTIDFGKPYFSGTGDVTLSFVVLNMSGTHYGINFLGWYSSDGETLISEQDTITIGYGYDPVFPGDIEIVAKYEVVCDVVWTQSVQNQGTIDVYYDQTGWFSPRQVPLGKEIRVIATPEPGYFFSRWSGAPSDWPNHPDVTFTLTGPLDFTAVFGKSPSGQIMKVL